MIAVKIKAPLFHIECGKAGKMEDAYPDELSIFPAERRNVVRSSAKARSKYLVRDKTIKNFPHPSCKP